MHVQPENRYGGYREYAVRISDDHTLECSYAGHGVFAPALSFIISTKGGKSYCPSDYFSIKTEWAQPWYSSWCELHLICSEGPSDLETVIVDCIINRDGICLDANLPEGYTIQFKGELFWGEAEDTLAVAINRKKPPHTILRAALGEVATKAEDSLFDRKTDTVLSFQSDSSRLYHDRGRYRFTSKGKLKISVQEHYYERNFHVKYGAINKQNTFPKPPAGWMTWYAVKFDAGEQAVLENTKHQEKLLKSYGADTIWVDWEWYHSGLPNPNPPEQIGFFTPDEERYPRGLKFVSEEIKKSGFKAALWVGPTNEPALTPLCKKYEDAILAEHSEWCGKYFFDITNERVINELIPEAFQKVLDWGYDALKWDCLPMTSEVTDRYHSFLKHPEITTEAALRRLVQKARETVGEDFYMLSCSGELDRVTLMAADIFDAARIGADVWEWKTFVNDAVKRIVHLYPFHNVMLYCDPDNVVIRPEFCNKLQAISRVSLVSLLGLPMTFGDDLRTLEEERIEMLRRALPVMDVHPMDIWEEELSEQCLIIQLQIKKPYETWSVVDVLNTDETQSAEMTVSFQDDLHLDEGEYLVYDYWNRSFLGCFKDGYSVHLQPCESSVCAVRRLSTHPQILSTTRHLSQGAVDLVEVFWDEQNSTLSGIAETVAEDPYTLVIYVPKDYEADKNIGQQKGQIFEYSLDTTKGGKIPFAISFTKKI